MLLQVLVPRLSGAVPAELQTQVLYTMCNIANGPAAQKELLLEALPLMVGLMCALEHSNASVRAAAAWTIYNLSVIGRGEHDNRTIHRLKQLNFHTRLQLLQAKETSLDVLDRIASLRWIEAVETE